MSSKVNQIGFFRFKKDSQTGEYLITNDIGSFIFLSENDFKKFLDNKLDPKSKIYQELRAGEFIKGRKSSKNEKMVGIYRMRNASIFQPGPSLHIIVVTLKCNLRCVYCSAASRPLKESGCDMDLGVAKKTVDFIFKTPNPFITIEFQGGEPLANWEVVKFIIEYSKKKSEREKKDLRISLVSNLILMTKEKLKFLFENNVHICTSLDGPEEIHNKNRPLPGNNSYEKTISWIKKIKLKRNRNNFSLGALVTISKNSLKYPKEIINEYLKLGFLSIHLRPLTYLGLARSPKNKISYSTKEFLSFWIRALDYIISLNKKGIFIYEREAQIMLQKILTNKSISYTDLRSPCGAVLGQVAYNYDGKIYTCDEGRMIKDDTFVIGKTDESNYKDIILNDKTKAMLVASCLDNLSCDNCVYKPYCGVCPVRNYAYYGNLFPQIEKTDWCKIKKAQFDYLFTKIKDNQIRGIFKKWTQVQ
jgi:His-Xaa-Ser system radical SAM maturase HxsB